MNKENVAIRFGDIYLIDWNPARGSEQAGLRPSRVIQNDAFNSHERYTNTIVAAVSKSGREIATHVKIVKSDLNGLWSPLSYVKCEQIMTISKSRLGRRLGQLTFQETESVRLALKRVLSLY